MKQLSEISLWIDGVSNLFSELVISSETCKVIRKLNIKMIKLIICHFADLSFKTHQFRLNKTLSNKILERTTVFHYFLEHFDELNISCRFLLKFKAHLYKYEYK